MKHFLKLALVYGIMLSLLPGLLSLKPGSIGYLTGFPESTLAHIKFHSRNKPIIIIDKANWSIPADSVFIPLRRTGRLFLIQAHIDGETGYLVFDTGASGLVLNKSYFRNHVVISSQNSKGITGVIDAEKITIDSLEISGIIYTRQDAVTANLGHIENRRGVKILGLFGFALLKNFEILIDARNSQLRIYKTDAIGNRIGRKNSIFTADYTQKFEFQNNILMLKATIGGKKLKFCLDSGAETNVMDNNSQKDVLKTITITRRTQVRGTGSTVNEVLYGKMTDFKLDQRQLAEMETIIVNLEDMSAAYNTHIDGMLGYNFLSKGLFCINFVKRELSISFSKQEEL